MPVDVLKTVANSIHHGKTIQKVKHEPLEKGDDSGGQEDEETIMIIQGTQLETALASHIIDSGVSADCGFICLPLFCYRQNKKCGSNNEAGYRFLFFPTLYIWASLTLNLMTLIHYRIIIIIKIKVTIITTNCLY